MKTRIVVAVLLLVAGAVSGAPDFVIVSPPDLRAAWEVYAQRRQAAQPDLDIAVTGTDAIYAAYPFGPGLPCRNAAESIHAYIREAAQAGATHFLLGGMWLDARDGDTNELYFATGERLSLSNCVPGICARPYSGTDSKGGDIPSDMYYACLDDPANGIVHPWDPSGDGTYLSADEYSSCDCVPDVAVGRFAAVPYAYGGTAAQSPSELVLAYEGDVSVGTGSVFDLSDPAVTVIATTNLQLAAGGVLKVCVTPDGCDLIDAREGTCELPIDGEVMLDVTVRPDTPPGLYAVLASPCALPACWAGRFTVPGRQPAELTLVADRTILCVRVRRAGTVLILR